MGISIDKAEIVAIFVESVLYGVLCVTFIVCLYTLIYRRSTRRLNWAMVITAILLFTFSTMHVIIDLIRMIFAFYTYRDEEGGPSAFFFKTNDITHVLKSAVYITHTCVSDCLVVYRCQAVCRNKTITLFLSLMVIGSAVAGYGSIYELVHIAPFSGSIFSTSLAPYITAFNVITAATNIIATSLISWFIWRINYQLFQYTGASKLSPVIIIIVESGAVYAFSLLLLTALYTSDNNAQFVVLDAVTPIIGIVFCLIIIQVGLRARSPSASQAQTSTWKWTNPDIRMPTSPTSTRTRSRQQNYPLSPIRVDVNRTTDRRVDLDVDPSHDDYSLDIEESMSHKPTEFEDEESRCSK